MIILLLVIIVILIIYNMTLRNKIKQLAPLTEKLKKSGNALKESIVKNTPKK